MLNCYGLRVQLRLSFKGTGSRQTFFLTITNTVVFSGACVLFTSFDLQPVLCR